MWAWEKTEKTTKKLIGWGRCSAVAKPTLFQGPCGRIFNISVSQFLDCFPYFKLLSLCVGVRRSSWWLMQQSSRRSLCQNVSEKQVAGVSINPHCPLFFFFFFIAERYGWQPHAGVHTHTHAHTFRHTHTHTHTLCETDTQAVGHPLSVKQWQVSSRLCLPHFSRDSEWGKTSRGWDTQT